MSFAGMRVLAFETRRAAEIAELIRRQQGEPQVAPALREAPIHSNDEAFRFAARLAAGEFDMMILLTGVGTRALAKLLEPRYPFVDSLRRITVVARGPKPLAACRELAIPVALTAPEPNTWREIITAIESRRERKVALQEYGRPAPELVAALEAQGRQVSTVAVYQYALPEDTWPLEQAAAALVQGRAGVTLFTTAVQIAHLAQIARRNNIEAEVLAAVNRTVVCSIGPTTTEALEEFGIRPDVIPSHPKMGFLLKEASDQAPAILARKRGA